MGCDLLRRFPASINFDNSKFTLNLNGTTVSYSVPNTSNSRTSLKTNPQCDEIIHISNILTEICNGDIEIFPGETVVIAPGAMKLVPINTYPVRIPGAGRLIPKETLLYRKGLKIPCKFLGKSSRSYPVVNVTDNYVEHDPSTSIGILEGENEMFPEVNVVDSLREMAENQPLGEHKDVKKEIKFDVNPDLTPEQRKELLDLLQEFEDVFAFSVYDIKVANFVEASLVPIDPNKIIHSRPFRFPPQDKEDAKEYVNQLRKYNIVEESHAPHENAIFFIKKANSNNKRCLSDMRKLNDNLEPYSYPTTLQDQYLDSFSGSRYFSTLDLRSGFWGISLHPDSRD